jgi:hypothetical protein
VRKVSVANMMLGFSFAAVCGICLKCSGEG